MAYKTDPDHIQCGCPVQTIGHTNDCPYIRNGSRERRMNFRDASGNALERITIHNEVTSLINRHFVLMSN